MPNGFPVFCFFEKCLFFFLVLPKGETGDLNLGEVDCARIAQLSKGGFERIESGLRETSREMPSREEGGLERGNAGKVRGNANSRGGVPRLLVLTCVPKS